jgi:hypothetical protein
MRTIITTLIIATLTACGGGGGDDPTPQEQAAELLKQNRTLFLQMTALRPNVPQSMIDEFNARGNQIYDLWPVPQTLDGVQCSEVLTAEPNCYLRWQILSGVWHPTGEQFLPLPPDASGRP